MRIWASPKGTEISLDVQEKKTLRRAAQLLATLAKHDGGRFELDALAAIGPVADKWAPEETTNATK